MAKERLLKWYNYNESSLAAIQNIPFPTTAAAPMTIASFPLKQIHTNDRISLEATIQWTASLTGTAASTGPAAFFLILGYQQAIFQFWRDSIGTLGTLVYQFTTTGGFISSGFAATSSVNIVTPNSITTTISATDINVPKGKHTYYLTVAIPATNPSGAVGSGVIPPTAASLVNPTVVNWHTAGFVIDENGT
ncbi:hypothetical protein ACFQZT_20325 [Paenibacillus sp. GCM10027628]|uniref:hypothetical protein n=1 Tax=Paenibacillus sp. GCM10027628 TaxID=3273413 RepID=UPI0036390F7E